MRYHFYIKRDTYKYCLLVNKIDVSYFDKQLFPNIPIDKNDCLILDLKREGKKTKVSTIKSYMEEVYPIVEHYNCKYLIFNNIDYFRYISKKKTGNYIGYLIPIKNYRIGFFPDGAQEVYTSRESLSSAKRTFFAICQNEQGLYVDPGTNIFKEEHYPREYSDIIHWLKVLFSKPVLTCDIETFSLAVDRARIRSIAFCWEEGRGVAFPIDASITEPSKALREALADWFEHYQGKLIFHNIAFDASVLIYNLWMQDITDVVGLQRGLSYFKNFEDTKLIAYLCTNSASGNSLGLKALSQEYAGNYAQEDIGDITKIPEDVLLKYNLTDVLSTWYVYQKYNPMLDVENQRDIYENLFKPATIDIINMQLTGLPINMKRVLQVEAELNQEYNQYLNRISNSPLVQSFEYELNKKWVETKNAKLKVKKVSILDAKEKFNPKSNLQLREFLYSFLGLPITDYTDTSLPSVDASTIEKLVSKTTDETIKETLNAILDYAAVTKIITTFIPIFKQACKGKDGWYYVLGHFNLGGTVSGRLSSSNP